MHNQETVLKIYEPDLLCQFYNHRTTNCNRHSTNAWERYRINAATYKS